MVSCSLSEVTVYGGLFNINYALNPLRHRDLHFPPSLLQFRKTDPPIHASAAVRANSKQISQCFSLGLVIHHIFGWRLRNPASQAVHFPRLARPLVLCSFGLEKSGEVPTQYQLWPLVIDGGQTLLNPTPYSIFVNTEQVGYLSHGVIAVNFD